MSSTAPVLATLSPAQLNTTCDFVRWLGGCPHEAGEETSDLVCDLETQLCGCESGYSYSVDTARCLDAQGCPKGSFWHNLIEKCIVLTDEDIGSGVGVGLGVLILLGVLIFIIRSGRFCVNRAAHVAAESRKPSADSVFADMYCPASPGDTEPMVVTVSGGYASDGIDTSAGSCCSEIIEGRQGHGCGRTSTRGSQKK